MVVVLLQVLLEVVAPERQQGLFNLRVELPKKSKDPIDHNQQSDTLTNWLCSIQGVDADEYELSIQM